MTTPQARRVAVLWEHLSGYTQAALRAVLAIEGTELVVVQRAKEANAAFARSLGPSCEVIDLSDSRTSASVDLPGRIRAFAPDITLVTTNRDARYHAVAADNHRHGRITLWASDVPPRSLGRDSVGMARGRLGALRAYDAALVPGQAAHEYARRVGFAESKIFEGLYTCDAELFRPVGLARHASDADRSWPNVFLFVGQFIPRKGIDVLLEAYQRYRAHSTKPWELWCVGAGPLREKMIRRAGVRVEDFAEPAALAQLMGEAGALVLPSRIDHWGVVIHEAACAGLPLIASRTSYASLDLVQDGASGFTFPASDVDRLARLMSETAEEALARNMGQRSLSLSYRFDPAIFARLLIDHIPRMLRR